MLRISATKVAAAWPSPWGARTITNYYKLFPKTLPKGPPPNGPFDINIKSLKNEYLHAQRQSHPDVAGANSQISSADLGSAYRVLQDPVTRGEHILALQDANPLEEGAASLDNEDLLMEIMMAREHISEAESNDELATINNDNEARYHSTVKSMAEALEKGDTPTAQTKLVELTYWSKIRHAVQDKIEELAQASH